MKKLKRILYPLCAILLLYAAGNLWKIKTSTDTAKKLYDTLAQQASTEASAQEKSTGSAEEKDKVIANPWLQKLQEQNNELVGWIKIPDTSIDYPVMQTGSDNDYYLTHDFKKEKNVHGTPFLDINCEIGQSQNLIIYGHHMKDGTMFQNLMFYKDANYCKNNGTIYFDTPEKSEEYQVIFVLLLSEEETREFPYYKCIDLSKKEIYQGFLERCRQYALWHSDKLPKTGTPLLTLSTCEYSTENGRLVVVAKKII